MLLAGMQFRIILTSIPLLGGAAWAPGTSFTTISANAS